jgi:glycosidase
MPLYFLRLFVFNPHGLRRLKVVVWLLLVLLGTAGCKKDTPVAPPGPQNPASRPGYGQPFTALPAIEDIIMYEVNLRAFGPGSNLQAVISKLDHIQSLGTNVIWLMPIYPIGTVNSVNSPYSVRDYKAVASEYGSLADLRQLTDAAHARGMAVMLDWVANHTAWDHPWLDSTSWYTQNASGTIIHPPGTNWLDVADLNFNNQNMRKAMIEAMHYWIYEANIDGFRCDYADGVPFDFWQQAIQSTDTMAQRNIIFFAEGKRNNHFEAGFDLCFGWSFNTSLKNIFISEPAYNLYAASSNEYRNTPPGKHWVRFTSNHDASAWEATPIQIFNGQTGAMSAWVITNFLNGVPLIYSSQEVATVNTVPFFSRSIINWNANPAFLAAKQRMLQFYAGSMAAKKGVITSFSHFDVVAFTKTHATETVAIMANVRNCNRVFGLPAALANKTWWDVMAQDSLTLGSELSLAPYQYFILR